MLVEIVIGFALFVLVLQYLTQKRPTNFPPGPNGIPMLGYLPFMGTKIPEKLAELGEKYGKIYSVYFGNHPLIFINDLKMAKEAFKDERFAGRPPLSILKTRSFGEQRGIVFSHGKVWTEQRKFTVKSLRDFGFGKGSMEALILDEVVDLISEFKKELNQPVNLEIKFNAAVLNSLWHLVAGERYSHDDPRLRKVIKLISEEFANINVGGGLFFFEWFAKIFPGLSGSTRFHNVIDQVYKFLEEHVVLHNNKLQQNNSEQTSQDLIDIYLKEIEATKDIDSSFYGEEGRKNLLVVLLDLFAAGSDTTSVTLGWTILYLITWPEVQKKVHEEIDSVIGAGRLPSLSDRPRMPYMEAVINETLRKSTITPLGGLHSTTETFEFHGYTIPKDTIVFANVWTFHQDKNYWKDPEKFRPERFLTNDGHFKGDDALLPFSIGKRVCLGESLARDSLFLFLTGLLQTFKFSLDPNESKKPSLEGIPSLISKCKPYKVILTERSSSRKSY